YETELVAKTRAEARAAVSDYLARVVSEKPESLLEKLPFISLGKDELKPRLIAGWRQYLERRSQLNDPVFGPWKSLASLGDEDYASQAAEVVAKLSESPEGIEPGQINPHVKAALQAEPPAAKVDLARIYGKLLTDALEKWKQAGGNDAAEEKLEPAWRQLADVLLADDSPTTIHRDELRGYITRAERNRHRELQKQIESFQASSPNAPPRAMVLEENDNPHNPRVFLRGSQDRPGEQVPRQFLAVLEGEQREPFTNGSGRLELAQEIVADDNPLTARVIVNRIWGRYFGQPLVETTSDFGIRTERPGQADVLDYLAWRLRESGWSLKAIHREIVTSSVYRQSSNAECGMRNAESVAADPSSSIPQSAFRNPHSTDPENQLLWRMNRKRLEFEPLRDSLLFVARRLDSAMGGRPVDLVEAPFSRRRAVYGFIDRQDLPNLLRVFDFASPDQSAAGRPVTTVPQQALFLMNSPFVIEQAKALSARNEVSGAASDAEKIAALYRIVFSRPPSEAEMEVGLAFVRSAEDSPLSTWEQFAQLLLLTNEFTYID
ncbi:MAG: DUF1553 domain-containing protein, partial [Planctomycetes bacterium]|nr:DUF1553 domain-containing protein [Planctomycetota bacterium]